MMFHFPKRKEAKDKQLGAEQVRLIQYFWLFLGNFSIQSDFIKFEVIVIDFKCLIHIWQLNSSINSPFLIFVT